MGDVQNFMSPAQQELATLVLDSLVPGRGDLPGERAYVKMSRLGTLAGVRRQAHQTPLEYSKSVGRAVPRTAAGAQALGWAFALGRYGREGVGEDGIDAAWKSVRARLLLRALRRLVPIGNA